MKKIIHSLFLICFLWSCKSSGSMASIEPKSGFIDLAANGEFRIWNSIQHPSFEVTLTNPSSSQSCEVYKVTSSGQENWVNPSLKAGQSLRIKVPSNGHVFFKNFNPNVLRINYSIEE